MKSKKIFGVAALFAVVVGCVAVVYLTTPRHFQFYDEITSIKNDLTFVITQPGFTNPQPVCDVYEWREEDSGDYLQTTVNYYVFQHGQGMDGDVEAYLEIYNSPDRSDQFVIEVSRSCWFELSVYYKGEEVVKFPTVTEDNLSPGYFTTTISP